MITEVLERTRLDEKIIIASWSGRIESRRDDDFPARLTAMNFMDALGENLTRYLHQKYFGEHGEIRFTKLVASADIDYGSIKFENGKIEISSKSLMVILAVLGGIQGGVMNYKDAKENIQELSQDVRYFVCNYAPENHYKVLEMYCQPRDAEDVIKDLERTQQ